ncbi:MAG: hypothetical protein ACE5K7_03010 [Phycisphaerae bacterium]
MFGNSTPATPFGLICLATAALLIGCGTDQQADTAPGTLRIKAFTDSLAQPGRVLPAAQQAPDDVDVNLTPTEYTIAFKRIVIKEVDEQTGQIPAELEIFSADTLADALIVDLQNASASDLLTVEDLPAGTYNKLDIEVFYLDMTVPTIYPDTESHDIAYRMVFEPIGLLEPRDLLLYLEPSWMQPGSDLAALVTDPGWYWMEMGNPDNVVPVATAPAHPTFHVLDLFADEQFWSSQHKVLEGGIINPPLLYDPADGGVLTIRFDLTGKFNFKDYHDQNEQPDGLWEIRKDSGIHPFPPDFDCIPQPPEQLESP